MVFRKGEMVKPPCGAEYPDGDWVYDRAYYCNRPEHHKDSHSTTVNGRQVFWS